jgi:hypothetical protein
VDLQPEQKSDGVGGDVALAPVDPLGGVISADPATFRGFRLWLSMMPAVGWALRPSA